MTEIDKHKLALEIQSLADNDKLPMMVRNEAGALHKRLRASACDTVDILLDLAVLYRKSRLFKEAASACNQAFVLAPQNARVHHIIGSIRQCTGDLTGAIASYRAAIGLDARLAEAHYFLGNILQMTGKTLESVESYQHAIRLRPDYLEALSNLGAVFMELHRFEEARNILLKAYRLYPDCVQVLCNLGDLVLGEDDFRQARFYAEAALKISPDFFDAHHLLGKICRQQEDYDQTLNHFYHALQIQPGNENLIGSIAEILEKRGEFNKARALLQPLIRGGTSNPLVLKAYSALSRNLNEEEKALQLLENTIKRGGLKIAARIGLHSELGKQYDHLGRYPQAFAHYRQANLLERELEIQSGVKSSNRFPSCENINDWFTQFDADYWQELPHANSDCSRPVFVVGMPRSGTTLTEQILASHPDIHGAGELPDIANLAKALAKQGVGPGRFQYLIADGPQKLADAAQKYLETLYRRSPGAVRVVDKMPTNFWHLGLVSLLFPDARVIHLKRDPRDTCLSMYFQRFHTSMIFTTDLDELAAYYLAYTRIMEYWESVLNIRVLDIQYEDLVSNPENTIRKMIDYCGLEWDDRCLQFHSVRRDIHTPSYDQVRQPMYSKSVGRWKNYRKELTGLNETLKQCL